MRKAHLLSMREYQVTHGLVKHCSICSVEITRCNNSGFCRACRPKSGEDSPFYGKTHSPAAREKMRKKWEDENYRASVSKCSLKPRSQEFKEAQSKRMTLEYQLHPERRSQNRERMKRSWAEGTIVANPDHVRIIKKGPSKLELDLFRRLSAVCPYTISSNSLVVCASGKVTFPDILVQERKLIIEFMGDTWHANPEKYGPMDLVWPYKRPAQEIWARDALRDKALFAEGFTIEYIWEKDFKQDPEAIVTRYDRLWNWEGC